jgi:hypothetical protein
MFCYDRSPLEAAVESVEKARNGKRKRSRSLLRIGASA